MTVNGDDAIEWLGRSRNGKPLVARVSGLLDPDAHRALHRACVAERKWFVEASTEGADDYRRALVHYATVDEATPVVDRALVLAPRVAEGLGVELPRIREVERQLTVHLDGGFYRPHRDDQGEDASRRALSYVYYFHEEARWRGGQLAFLGEPGLELEPLDNSLILFSANLEHEVRRLEAPSPLSFEEGRFTVNGWIWR